MIGRSAYAIHGGWPLMRARSHGSFRLAGKSPSHTGKSGSREVHIYKSSYMAEWIRTIGWSRNGVAEGEKRRSGGIVGNP
jgi:hypothetical protein